MGRRERHGALVLLFCALQLLVTFADGSSFSLRTGVPSSLSKVPRAIAYNEPTFHALDTSNTSNSTNTTVIPPYPGLDTNPCAFIIGTSDTRNSVKGFFVAFFLVGALVALGIGLTWWNYRNNRWDHVNFERIPLYKSLKMKRSRADWFRLLTLLVDTIQIMALVLSGNYVFNFWGSGDGEGTGLSFSLLHTEYPKNVYNFPKAVIKLFLWDFDEIGFWVTPSEYNETFFAVVKFCIFVSFGFFFLCAAIYSQVEFILNRFPIGRMFVNTFSLIGPFISDWCFIPVMYNFLATFNCMKERRFYNSEGDWTPFVGRDCPATCWEGDHMTHIGVAIVGILLYFPWSIYTRPVWQMLPDSLTLRDQPRFVILTIHWKLMLVSCHAFLPQFPIAHALGYFILTGGMLYFSVKWEPTTVPYFDLICLTAKAVTFWASISVVCGLFLPGFVTFLLLGIGEGLILTEFFLMNGTNMGDTGGKYAPDSIDWHKHQDWLKKQKLLEQNEKRRRLEKVAEYRHELMTASDPRLVQAPDSAVLSGSIKIKQEGNSASADDVEDNDEPLVFKDTITGQHVRVLPIKNRSAPTAPAMKVMGLKLEAKIPSQTPMSFQFRPDDPERGTLLIMRSPDMSLYSYLQMKLNAYHAYYRAFEMDPAVAVEAEKRAKALAMGKDPNKGDKKKSSKDKKAKKEKKGSGKDGKETKEERKARKDKEKKEKEDAKKKKKDKKTRKSSVPGDINLLKSRHKYLTVLRGPSINIMPEKVVQVEEPVAPYRRVNNGSLLAIAQNIGPDFRSFQSNISQHAASLSSWIAARRASPAAIGAELCAIFGIEPYTDTVIIEVPDERNALLQAKVKELEASLENMEKELEDRMTTLVQREYNKGVAEGRKKKREIALEAAKQKANK